MTSQAFTLKFEHDLPEEWKIEPTEACMLHASKQLGIARDKLTSTAGFELPECAASTAYINFCRNPATNNRLPDMPISVIISSVSDFAAARETGAVLQAVAHLHEHGFPKHYIRSFHLKQDS